MRLLALRAQVTRCLTLTLQLRLPARVLSHPSFRFPSAHSFHTSRAIMATTWVVEPAKTSRSGCKECKDKIDKDTLRIGKVTSSPFSDDGNMTLWYHHNCFFKMYVCFLWLLLLRLLRALGLGESFMALIVPFWLQATALSRSHGQAGRDGRAGKLRHVR